MDYHYSRNLTSDCCGFAVLVLEVGETKDYDEVELYCPNCAHACNPAEEVTPISRV